MTFGFRRVLPAIVAFGLAIGALVPPAASLPQQVDEGHYAYISAYYGEKLAHLDFSPTPGENESLDPGWAPITYWSLTQPMGARYLYAAALGVTGAPPPALPWPSQPELGPDPARDPLSRIPAPTMVVMRSTAVLLAALGLALMALRLGWPGVVAIGLFLLIPHARNYLARGWAEGPLLFGFGLAAATWGTRAFAPACGLAALFKLNALPLWPLAFYHGFGRSRFSHVAGVAIAWLVWAALEPPSWYFGGPLYLVPMVLMRGFEYGFQSGVADPEVWGGLFGHYLPTRYLWPFELALFLGVALLASRLRLRRRVPEPVAHP